MYLHRIFLLSLPIFNVLALKGLNRRPLRRLQNGLPMADPPKDSEMPPPPPPKKDESPGAPKDKKAKKCKTAKLAPPAPTPGGGRFLIEEPDAPPKMEPPAPLEEEEYCLHGNVTEAQCQEAMSGKLPKGHQKIQGDLSIAISYRDLGSSDVLKEMQEILRSETAHDFIGCDSSNTRRRRTDDANMTHDHSDMEPPPPPMGMKPDLQVTGVDFTKPKLMKDECQAGANVTLVCDTISSNVQIYFQGGNASDADEMEMFALLITTIQNQARDGSFSDIATIEQVALTSGISQSTSTDGEDDNDTAQTVGIPTGVVGGTILIAAVAILAYCCFCRGRNDERDGPKEEDIIVAEAIVVENEEEEDLYHKKKSKTRFL